MCELSEAKHKKLPWPGEKVKNYALTDSSNAQLHVLIYYLLVTTKYYVWLYTETHQKMCSIIITLQY